MSRTNWFGLRKFVQCRGIHSVFSETSETRCMLINRQRNSYPPRSSDECNNVYHVCTIRGKASVHAPLCAKEKERINEIDEETDKGREREQSVQGSKKERKLEWSSHCVRTELYLHAIKSLSSFSSLTSSTFGEGKKKRDKGCQYSFTVYNSGTMNNV